MLATSAILNVLMLGCLWPTAADSLKSFDYDQLTAIVSDSD